MIVQCGECNAKFRLDDSKVKEGGTRVRCSKCKHTFIVQNDRPADEPDFDSFLNGLESPPPETSGDAVEAVAPGTGRPAAAAPAEPALAEAGAGTAEVPHAEKDDFDFTDYAFEAETATSPAVPAAADQHDDFDIDVSMDFGMTGGNAEAPKKQDVSFDADAFAFAEEPPAAEPRNEALPQEDLSSFDFDGSAFAEETVAAGAEPVAVQESGPPAFDHDAFSFSEEPPPSVPPSEEASKTGAAADDFDSFSFSEQPFDTPDDKHTDPVPSFDSDSFSFDEPSAAPEAMPGVTGTEGTTFAADTPSASTKNEAFSAVPPLEFSFEPEAAEPVPAKAVTEGAKGESEGGDFDFGEFEFSEAAPVVVPGDKKQEPAEKSARQEAKPFSYEQPGVAAPHADDIPLFADEAPPLSISSRRRGGSFLPIALIALSVLLVLAVAGGGFVFFKEGPAGLNRVGLGFVANLLGLEAKEEGGVAIRNPAAAFMNNNEAGEIFVISGEAVNNFGKPRGSIQVKASVYGANGEVLQQKSVYCGNSLSKDQLTTLPVAELEKVMGNPFGDSLSNLAVQPGKAIPFVIVFTRVPKGAADFGVQVESSTVATK